MSENEHDFQQWLTDRLSVIFREEEAVLDPADADNLAHVVAERLCQDSIGPHAGELLRLQPEDWVVGEEEKE